MKIKGLYAIIDNSVRRDISNVEITKNILAGGGKVIQLRGKELPLKELLSQALKIKELASLAGALFVVNDRADIALLCDADGVHLGQDDLLISAARRILGKDKLIGISTHNLDQAVKAEQEGADYIGFGPVFATKTKADAEEAKGLELISELKSNVKIPIVAIGGITLDNVAEVIKAGAQAAAVISAIVSAENIELTTSKFVETFKVQLS